MATSGQFTSDSYNRNIESPEGHLTHASEAGEMIEEPTGPLPFIQADIARKLTFASHQCGIAVINELTIGNNGGEAIHDAVLQIEANPTFLTGKTWHVDRLNPKSRVSITDRDISLNGQMLLELSEAMSGELTVRLRCDQETLVEEHFPIELLARNEWGGTDFMPELLAAFVTPNDPAVSKNILKPARDALRRAGKDDSIDGYKSRSRTRVWEIASSIWSAIVARNLSYALPPASFETHGQKIRSPSMVMEEGVATCLDATLLFAAALEQAGLNPVVGLLREHSIVGVWLQPEEFSSLIVDDASTIRKRTQLNELILFETTFALRQRADSFSSAIRKADWLVSEDSTAKFSMLIDIRRARMRRYCPVSLNKSALPGSELSESEGTAPIEAAPPLPDFDIETEEDEPDTPESRLDRWQRRLLDLSLRNKLLNFKTSKAAIKLHCPDPGALEDKLADGKALTFKEAPERTAARLDDEIHITRTGERLDEAYALDALESNQLIVDLSKEDLESRLIKLFRKARAEMQEGGANTLYVALGFLVWKKDEKNEQKFRAPLILIPVSLTRQSVRAGVRMKLFADEPRMNSTLLQMLRQDFNLKINGLDEYNLPKDDHGINVQLIWNLVRKAVKDSEGFEVVEETILSTFSFAKYLMWKDLTDRTDKLKENSVVRHLIDSPKESYPYDVEFPDPSRLDTDYHPSDFYTPLPADSYQLACVVAAAQRKNFVLIGPPGTGKSQTISNMITHLLGEGKTVLFVSEKMAALNVVYKRLEAHGLGPFCLELHSNKARKLDVLNQLRQSWTRHFGASHEQWEECARKLKNVRDELNGYVESMHRSHRNGLTIHYALGVAVRDKHLPVVDLKWLHADEHSDEELTRMREAAHDIDVNAEAMGAITDSPLSIIYKGDWSPSWQHSIGSGALELSSRAKNLRAELERLLSRLNFSVPTLTLAHIRTLSQLVVTIRKAVGKDIAFTLGSGGRNDLKKIEEGLELLSAFREDNNQLSVRYADRAWDKLDGEELASEWATAVDTWWPKSLFAKSKIRKQMRDAGATKKPDPANDALILAAMSEKGGRLDDLNSDLEHVRVWRGFDTDIDPASEAMRMGNELRRLTATIGENRKHHLPEIRTRLHALLQGDEELLEDEGSIGLSSGTFVTALSDFEKEMLSFDNISGSSLSTIFAEAATFIDEVVNAAGAVHKNQVRLNDWCAWRRVRDQAVDLGLLKLAEAVESGVVPVGSAKEVFEANYCTWWLDAAVDNDDLLKKFSSHTHTDRIQTFRHLDDEFMKITSRYVVAKLSGTLPSHNEVTKNIDFGILRRELEKNKRHKPLRQLMTEIPEAVTQLTPCLLMSPLSVAQYLPTEHRTFDVVIFDEASQITVWDAVGAIARGRQVVVAGDQRQLPPTNFFARSEDDEDGEVDDVGDMESILDEMLGSNVPCISLYWHYRSKNESLITFSNHRYYEGRLITLPSPVTEDKAVKLVRIEGHYDRGGSRTNHAEALAVVKEIKRRLSGVPKDAKAESIGVITFNSAQQRLIEDLLDEARREDKTLEPHFSDDTAEPVFVKNLETVQGDERDVCLFSIAYGPDITGHMKMNFGPLNRVGGERRLNVAITRARSELLVIATVKPDQIDLSTTSSIGVRDLKHFLQFAEVGVSAISEAVFGSQGDFDSPFEQAVARQLRQKGWQLHTQVGVSSYRIDLGVVHPKHPGRYLCGIECDGATYHRSATARDRDKIRESVLNGLGWRLLRIWSTDFWHNPDDSINKLQQDLTDLLENSRKEELKEEERREEESDQIAITHQRADALELFDEEEDVPGRAAESIYSKGTGSLGSNCLDNPTVAISSDSDDIPSDGKHIPEGFALYRRANLQNFFSDKINSEAFYERSYNKVLQEMVQNVLNVEGPILLDDLVTRIARVHGFKRSGARIRKRVATSFKRKEHLGQDPDGTEFVWPANTFDDRGIQPRLPATDDDIRLPSQIPMEELIALAERCNSGDVIYKMARLLRIKRVGRDVRARLAKAIL